MKFKIKATSGELDRYDLSLFDISKNSTGESFIEINTSEKILALSKVTGQELIIYPNLYHDSIKNKFYEEGFDGYIEIYDDYRE